MAKEIIEIIFQKSLKSKKIVEAIISDDKISEQIKNIITDISLNDLTPLNTWINYRGEMPLDNPSQVLEDSILKIKIRTIDIEISKLKEQFILIDKTKHEDLAHNIMLLLEKRKELYTPKAS